MEISGVSHTLDALMHIIKRETVFFDQSGGGVTFSGGEPLLYPDFLVEVLELCGAEGIHRTVDTSGFAEPTVLADVARRTDLFLFDLKVMDPEKHKKYCGVDNALILQNLEQLAAIGADIWIRVPLIQGVNADACTIMEMAAFVAGLAGPPKPVHLLPFHNIAIKKYEKMGKHYDFSGLAEPTQKDINHIISLFAQYGVKASVGG